MYMVLADTAAVSDDQKQCRGQIKVTQFILNVLLLINMRVE